MARNTYPQVLAWDGTSVVVRTDGDTSEHRQHARKLACKAAGTAILGALVSADPGPRGTVDLTWHPRVNRAGGAVANVPTVRELPAPDVDPRDARIAELERMLAELKGAPVKAAAPARELPAFLVREPVACETCRDHGAVRKAGKHAGGAYRTRDGADAAWANGNAVKCPARGCAARKARKAA